jgi:oxygen-independent coproporphyrinogen-3 oxidase
VKFLTNLGLPLGLYLHIPFCNGKCAYCDFYSAFTNEELIDSYLTALIREIKQWGGKINRPIDTIYLGGGTPSLLNHRLVPLLKAVYENFTVLDNAEITLELNPADNVLEILQNAKAAGINRISIGAQSGNDAELSLLGRRHTAADTESAVKTARELGFDNLSLDLMLGLPNSNTETFKKSLDFIVALNPEHISAYILKIEENTKFFKTQNTLNLPDDDSICDQYLLMCDTLEKAGFCHYEISNFAKNSFESKHNLKYWNCEEYLGLGPSAHSFLDGKRFYYPRDLKQFIKGNTPIPDGDGGDLEEQIMLALRLKKGIKTDTLSPKAIEKCELFAKNGLGILKNGNFSLNDNGMLLSNTIISEILEEF